VLSRQAAIGKWGVATYQLKKAENDGGEAHRGHREDRNGSTPLGQERHQLEPELDTMGPSMDPMAPMPPMPIRLPQPPDRSRWRGRI
jgi:hypothetical protein